MKESKRFIKRLSAIVLCVFFLFISLCVFGGSSCKNSAGENADETSKVGEFYVKGFVKRDGFSVNFIDVGEGDAIFINFGDGKTMLIDCGEKGQNNFDRIKQYLDGYCENSLDYLLLTHPDADHVGNAERIANYITIDAAFLPDIAFLQDYSYYREAENALKAQNTAIKRSAVGCKIIGEDYTLVFLSPNAKGTFNSAYDALNAEEYPSPAEINDVSPIVYLEYKGVRMVFTGDAGKSQEKVAMENVKTGIIDRFLKKENAVNINRIDLLKVSHHGASDGSGAEFLEKLKPKYAVISVGGDNFYGHPATETLERLYSSNPDCEILRTSEKGTISVAVNEDGETSFYLQAA